MLGCFWESLFISLCPQEVCEPVFSGQSPDLVKLGPQELSKGCAAYRCSIRVAQQVDGWMGSVGQVETPGKEREQVEATHKTRMIP